jgi:hypothetical protein
MIAAQQLETVAEGRELDRAAGRRMSQRIAHFLFGHGAQLRGAKAVGAVHEAADRYFAHAMVHSHPDIGAVECDVATMAEIGAVEAAVIGETQRRERAQRIVVGAEIAGAKGDRVGRAGAHQHVRRQPDQLFLRGEREIADIAPGEPPDGIEAREGEPFGVDVKLHLVPARDDGRDDVADDRRPVDERGHRIDEEHALEAVSFEHVHLEDDAEIALAAAAEDRAFEIGARALAPLIEARRQFGVEADDRARHRSRVTKRG